MKGINMESKNSFQLGLFDDAASVMERPVPVTVSSKTAVAKVVVSMVDKGFVLSEEVFEKLGGARSKVAANIQAIKLMLKYGARTMEEKAVIAAYSGWGSLSALFADTAEFSAERAELKALIDEKSYVQARDSVLTAYYTEPHVVQAMWALARAMGFNGGKVLEPACGTGNFIGAMPMDIRQASTITMVEPDTVSSAIARSLYSDDATAVYTTGIENVSLQSDSFDVVIGNVPFGNFSVYDKRFDAMKLPIHDYMIAKSLDLVRPGGIVLLVTSTGTLDKESAKFRSYLDERADLVTAIRLPSGAFQKLGGTKVATDILVLKKRVEGQKNAGLVFTETSMIDFWKYDGGYNAARLKKNKFFFENPQCMLGTPTVSSNQYGVCVEYVQIPGWEKLLQDMALDKRLEGLYVQSQSVGPSVYNMPADTGNKSYLASGYFLDDKGELFYMLNQEVQTQSHLPASKKRRIEAMVMIRDCAVELLEQDSLSMDSKALRSKMNRLYDNFVAEYGYLMKPYNRRLFSLDSHAPLLWSLERYDDEEEKAVKTDIFTKSTVGHAALSETAETLAEALALSYNRHAKLNIQCMATALSISEDQVIEQLLAIERVFYDPELLEYVDSDVYLSGNVRRKLSFSRMAMQGNERYLVNTKALEAVVPATVQLRDVSLQLGVPWITAVDVQAFIDEVVTEESHIDDPKEKSVKITQLTGMSTWTVAMPRYSRKLTLFTSDWGTVAKPFDTLLGDLLNQRSTTVYVEIERDDKTVRVVDKEAT